MGGRQDVPKKNQIEQAIEDAAQQFALQIIEIVRSATIEELSALTATSSATPKKRGRPPKVATLASKAEAPAKKPRKKRDWPKCSVEGCETNVYMPSGAKKMCYQHHLEAGGKPTPLLGVKKKGRAKKPAKPVKATKAEKPTAKPSKTPVVKPTPAKAEKVEPKAKKKRKWPQCSVEGCEKNLYAPSPKKMCYAHHMEAGGAPSPLVAARMKKADASKKAESAAKPKKKAIVRKKDQPKA